MTTKRERIAQLIDEVRDFHFCGPSDDPDEQIAVATGYHYLVTQLKRQAGHLLPEAEQARLNSIEVDIGNIYSAYEARAEIDALLPDIEEALQRSNDTVLALGANKWIVDPQRINKLSQISSTDVDFEFLSRLCREINSCFAQGHVLATLLLMRTILNYVPPVFGHDTFAQVVAQSGRSLKQSFDHLENGLRKIADFQTHRQLRNSDLYPTMAQVEPYKPQFELLIDEVMERVKSPSQS